MQVQPVVEDLVQERIVFKLFSALRPELDLLNSLGGQGNSYIRLRMKGFNDVSHVLPHFIITDLDNTPCAAELISKWIDFQMSDRLLFRIAVREVEAWLLADRKNFAKFFGVPVNKIPLHVEQLSDPKEFVINLARKSRKKGIREDIIPEGTSKVGAGYNLRMEEFIHFHWNFNEALQSSKSLEKAVLRIKEFLRQKN